MHIRSLLEPYMQQTYPSDIPKEQCEVIREIFESIRKKTKPRTVDTHHVFNGLLYVLKTGYQWSALSHDYPKYKTVYSYFMKWSEERMIKRKKQPSVLEEALKKLMEQERMNNGRKPCTNMVIADAQSVKNTDSVSQKCMTAGRSCLV